MPMKTWPRDAEKSKKLLRKDGCKKDKKYLL